MHFMGTLDDPHDRWRAHRNDDTIIKFQAISEQQMQDVLDLKVQGKAITACGAATSFTPMGWRHKASPH